MTVTEKDRDVLARTLWGGSRGEGLAGMVAVAWSIRNRVDDGKDKSWWGEGFADVCQKPYRIPEPKQPQKAPGRNANCLIYNACMGRGNLNR